MKNLVRGVEGWLLNGSAVLTSRRENEIKGIGQYMETSGWQMKNFVNFPRGLFYIKLHSPISESILLCGQGLINNNLLVPNVYSCQEGKTACVSPMAFPGYGQ